MIVIYNAYQNQIEQIFKAPPHKKQLDAIIDIFKTSTVNEYCLLSRNGMFFISIEKTGKPSLMKKTDMFTFKFDPENV